MLARLLPHNLLLGFGSVFHGLLLHRAAGFYDGGRPGHSWFTSKAAARGLFL